MRDRGLSDEIIHATACHGYGITVDIAPEHEMEKVLYAVDELTGLIGAVAVMRPSKSVQDLEVSRLRKIQTQASPPAVRNHPEGADMLG